MPARSPVTMWQMLPRTNLRRMRLCFASFRSYAPSHRPHDPSNDVSTIWGSVAKFARDRHSILFTTLFALGIAAAGYGIHEAYQKMTIWPPGLRQDLRTALRRKYDKDFEASEAFFRRAWATAISLPPSELAPQPYLKTTGIAIALGSMLESINCRDQAYDIYADALVHIQEAGSKTPLTSAEQLRGVALACKLAEMANARGLGNEEEEKWLVWAVQVILKNIIPSDPAKMQRREGIGRTERPGDDDTLDLPQWVSATDLAAPLESLGTLYARTDRNHYALPMFLHAISILVPPPPLTSTTSDRCRGAQTMSAVSELIMRINPTQEGLAQAEAWSRKALDIAKATKAKTKSGSGKWPSMFYKTPDTDQTCEVALAVSLFNIGLLRQMSGDNTEARKYLEMSLRESKMIGLYDGVVAAKEALERVKG